ncbi:aspartate kinase [Tumebacillus permanentifrigoris]|uniref:Aspartokinase n=1 Tax=Tumebacillus permanentifrigoris TaxID=378543 RepID=A0A316DZD6_9BACL|nr:aspartate kinase [Tumebacillus permanentifrigoris]PWK15870.1 aspartate kinase [Tumebacillus permanentifrigoris]
MSLLVQKFGGTSVANPDRIQKAARRLVETCQAGHQVVAVVSAMGHATDELLQLAGHLSANPSAREIDMLLSTGEQVTCALMAIAVQQLGLESVSLTGGQAGIRAESEHGQARIQSIDPTRVHAELATGKIVVIAGFQGLTDEGEIATLGRGGSDTTAVALAGALGADLCEIYTDVDGVYTTDPRLVPAAKRIHEIPYDEMWELARLGANVLHPRAVESARRHGVPVRVRSSFDYEDPGTLLQREVPCNADVRVYGLALDLDLQEPDVAKVSVVVTDSTHIASVQAHLSDCFNRAGIVVHDTFTTQRGISCLVDRSCAHTSLQALHTELGLDARVL